MREPRGRILTAVRKAGPFQVAGRKPLVVVRCKTGTYMARRQLAFLARKHGIDLRPAQEFEGGWVTAYEAVGTGAALDTFIASPVVVEAHFALSASVGRHAAGSGPVKEGKRPLSAREEDRCARVAQLTVNDTHVAARKGTLTSADRHCAIGI